MSLKVTFFMENFVNLPSEKAVALFAGSMFTINSIKINVEKLDNVENLSKVGESPFFSLDLKLQYGLDCLINTIESVNGDISNKGDEQITVKSLQERKNTHDDILLFNFARSLLSSIFLYSEWIDNFESTCESYKERYCWPLSRIIASQKHDNVKKDLEYNFWGADKHALLTEFQGFLALLDRGVRLEMDNSGSVVNCSFLQGRGTVSRLDVLLTSHLHVMRAHHATFVDFTADLSQYRGLTAVCDRVWHENNGAAANFWRDYLA